jgi:hypothetical protein
VALPLSAKKTSVTFNAQTGNKTWQRCPKKWHIGGPLRR